jgi:hypothetical protein
MVILYIYSTSWHMKSVLYERQQLANNVGSKSFSKKFKTQMDTSLKKAQHNKGRYVDNIWL